jgi:putative membrane protein
MKLPTLLPFLHYVLALHVLSVILWMAGMLVLPLIYLRHRALEPSAPARAEFAGLERLIFKRLLNPAMYAAWGFGILLILTPGTIRWGEHWWQVKFVSVLLLSWYHGKLSAWRRKLRDGTGPDTAILRLTAIIPFALTALVVAMVIIQP